MGSSWLDVQLYFKEYFTFLLIPVLFHQGALANGEAKTEVSPAKEVAVDGHTKSE